VTVDQTEPYAFVRVICLVFAGSVDLMLSHTLSRWRAQYHAVKNCDSDSRTQLVNYIKMKYNINKKQKFKKIKNCNKN